MKIDLGINIGAGTWGISSSGQPVPGGVEGSAYWYPHAAEIELAAKSGVKAVRMGTAASRVYSSPTATVLNPNFAKLVAAVRHARGLGMRVYFCFHEYGYAWGQLLTTALVPAAVRCFEPLAEFKNDPGFIACSWNEPQAINGDGYWPILTAWHKAMRAAGWSQTLGVSAANWAGFGQIPEQIDRFTALGDKNILIEGHYYFDLPPTQWASWSGMGHGPGIWNLTEADVATAKFKEVVETNWSRAFQPTFDAARKAGLRVLIGETSLPFGPVGNAVRRLLLPKWEANADVLADRLLWIGAQHQSPDDANRLFGETADKQPFATPLLLDEIAARRELEPVTAPPPAPVPTADFKASQFKLMESVVTMSKSAMSRTALSAAMVQLRDSFR